MLLYRCMLFPLTIDLSRHVVSIKYVSTKQDTRDIAIARNRHHNSALQYLKNTHRNTLSYQYIFTLPSCTCEYTMY